MSDSEAELQTKLLQLQRAAEKSETILQTKKKRTIERHVESLQEISSEVNKLRRAVEAGKIAKEANADEIDNWNTNVEEAMEKADSKVELLQEWLDEQDVLKERKQLDEKAERENIEREKQLQFELKLHEAKLKLQSEIAPEVNSSAGSEPKVQAKLPKLHITKFNGTYADWPRFWNLFSETIDKTHVSPVNKFAYLRELLGEKAKKSVEALPHCRRIQPSSGYP